MNCLTGGQSGQNQQLFVIVLFDRPTLAQRSFIIDLGYPQQPGRYTCASQAKRRILYAAGDRSIYDQLGAPRSG